MMRRIFIAFLLTFISLSAEAAELRIAAASDLQNVLPEITKLYEQQSGNKVLLTFGASGTLYAQIKNGAPFDVFLSADLSFPQALIDTGLADPKLVARYANGKLVLWVKNGLALQAKRDGIAILKSDLVQKIAMANPQHAPYGRVAQSVLEKADIYTIVKDKIVLGENISQAAQFATSGNVDAAFISQSSSLSPQLMEKGVVIKLQKDNVANRVPDDDYAVVEQAAAVLKSSANPKVASDFMLFLLGPSSRALFRKYGFYIPEPQCSTLTSWNEKCANPTQLPNESQN